MQNHASLRKTLARQVFLNNFYPLKYIQYLFIFTFETQKVPLGPNKFCFNIVISGISKKYKDRYVKS